MNLIGLNRTAGQPALMLAQSKNSSLLQRLLEAGTDYHAVDEDANSARIHAVGNRDVDAVSLLLGADAVSNWANREGSGPGPRSRLPLTAWNMACMTSSSTGIYGRTSCAADLVVGKETTFDQVVSHTPLHEDLGGNRIVMQGHFGFTGIGA